MKAPRLGPRWWAFVASVMALLAPSLSRAHPARTSAVLLDIGARSIEVEMQLPLDQLGLALDRKLDTSPPPAAADLDLGGYVAGHFAATTRDGRPFDLAIRSLAVATVDGANSLVVHASLRPPEGATTRAFTLHDDVILHRVVTHKIFLSVRRDFDGAVFSDHPELLGVLLYQRESVAVDRTAGSWWRGTRSVFLLGVHHIAEGTDHLLFLLALLLPAPLLARRKRWGGPDTAGRSAVRIAKIVTAFTVGHSITLIAGAAGVVRIPGRPVEILIAASILVSAIHAIRPVFRGREPLLAAGFGLVHGLAFATVLADLGLDARALALGLLGFNLGVEAMQLAVVAATMPWLVLLSRAPVYAPLRVAGAAFAGVAAGGWIVERALGWPNPVNALVDGLFHHGLLVVALLAGASILATILRRLPTMARSSILPRAKETDHERHQHRPLRLVRADDH